MIQESLPFSLDSTGRRRKAARRLSQSPNIPPRSFFLLAVLRRRIRHADEIDQRDPTVPDGGIAHDPFAAVLAVLAGQNEMVSEDTVAARRSEFIDEGQNDGDHLGARLDVAKVLRQILE